MTVMQVAERLTAREYFALPDRPDSRFVELVEGELVVHQPLPRHSVAQLHLLASLHHWVRAEVGRGTVYVPLDVQLDEHNVFNPDVIWYSPGHGPKPDQRPSPVPDLVAEVRSPSTWRYDVGAKKAVYERRGLRELWLVDTAAAVVLVFRRSQPGAGDAGFDVALELGGADALTSPLLPGFSLPVAELFVADR